MSRRQVIVEMSVAEAKGLWQAAGNVIGHYDAMEAQFPNGSARAAAIRGYEKLGAAWAKAERS